jgi:hypothetical protein
MAHIASVAAVRRFRGTEPNIGQLGKLRLSLDRGFTDPVHRIFIPDE